MSIKSSAYKNMQVYQKLFVSLFLLASLAQIKICLNCFSAFQEVGQPRLLIKTRLRDGS